MRYIIIYSIRLWDTEIYTRNMQCTLCAMCMYLFQLNVVEKTHNTDKRTYINERIQLHIFLYIFSVFHSFFFFVFCIHYYFVLAPSPALLLLSLLLFSHVHFGSVFVHRETFCWRCTLISIIIHRLCFYYIKWEVFRYISTAGTVYVCVIRSFLRALTFIILFICNMHVFLIYQLQVNQFECTVHTEHQKLYWVYWSLQLVHKKTDVLVLRTRNMYFPICIMKARNQEYVFTKMKW